MYGFTYRLTCPDCGAPLAATEQPEHVCDAAVGRAVALFEAELAAWLETPAGRFAVWDAARGR
jgi:hypothetical protein